MVLLALMLGGCAAQSVTIRRVPSDHPAADNAAAAENEAAFAAAAASEADTAAAARPPAPLLTAADAPSMYTYDPWERANRFTYRFNARFDEAMFLPLANTYRRIPAPLRGAVHNFFGNLAEVDGVVNATLQWRLKLAARSLGRFAINSTIGIGGLLDVAKNFKLADTPTSFSATLSKWGMHPGPYLVIPFLGPSTLRDGIGFFADYGMSYAINVAGLYRGDVSWGLVGVNAIDQRANVNFRYYSTGSPFEYETVRFLYVRKTLIEDEGLRINEPRNKLPADAPAGK
jgi:phospholipid-binding lipoprotein MlaA